MSDPNSPFYGLTDEELEQYAESSRQTAGEDDQLWRQRNLELAAEYKRLAADRRASLPAPEPTEVV
jgi:hypothetical protein